MKKWMAVSIVIGLMLALTACGNSQTATASTALPLEGQLLVGTLKLESTNLAVSAEQATQLLPLWETLQSLASSGTAALQEVDAVVSQIEGTMSAQQISSITAMELTQQDLAAAIADTGASSGTSGSANKTTTSSAQFQAGAGGPGGGTPPTDMGGGLPASTGAQAAGQIQAVSTQAAASQSTGTIHQVPPALIQALVEILQKKIE